MPRTDENGNLEFHQAELPGDYQPPKMQHGNSILRAEEPEEITKRACKQCGKGFTLHVKYDPANPSHDLCDSCIIALPPDPNQRYPEKTYQTLASDGAVYSDDGGES
jgi:hypothetical protein